MLAVQMCKIHLLARAGQDRCQAAAVTPAARVVIVIIGSKGSVAGLVSPPGNLTAQPLGFRWILPDLEPGEVRGTTGVGVKSCNPCETTCGEGVLPERVRR